MTMVCGGISATFSVLISLSIIGLCYAKLDSHERTYELNLTNGRTVFCDLCPPGTHWLEHCTVRGDDTKCTPCDEGFFSPEYNRWIYCAPCGKACDSREYVTSQCTRVSNISCKCQEGYYREAGQYGICREISACTPGKGVVNPGNESTNTQCEDCAEGYFSANFSTTETCERCRVCPAEMVIYRQCQPNANTVCRSQDDDSSNAIVIGIVVGLLLGAAFITVMCCFCLMKERCAAIRKKLCKCCYRPYQECTQHDQTSTGKSAAPDDVGVYIPPDIIRNTHNGFGIHKEKIGLGGVPNGTANNSNGTANNSHYEDTDQSYRIDVNIFYMLREDLVSQEYPQFFRFLFSKGADKHIEESKMNYTTHGVKEIIYQILIRWRDLEKEDATPEKILDALLDWNRIDLHKKYSEIFGQSAVTMDKLKEDGVTTEV